MKSRTSFFNKTLLRKNVTRYAPLWGTYQLCLLIGLGLMYMEADNRIVNFWFASHVAKSIQFMGLVNLFFAALTAMLLFGDLFNSRMCNALHAMPVRRETLFATNVLSGLLFSLVPTAVMALLAMPLLGATVVHNAWQIAVLWFVGVNLEFVCYFGIAVLCIFCTGNRMGFGTLYTVFNGGAYLLYAIVDMLYTPMLYGVVTPSRVADALTPIANMLDDTFVEVANYNDMLIRFDGRMHEAVADFWVDENFYSLFLFAAVGMVMMVLALLMYRRRDLECAGDAVAFRWLAPVFQTIAAVVGTAAAVLCLEIFFGYSLRNWEYILYSLAFCGLVVGWFAGKMLLERSTRVFRPKNWMGLGILAAIFAVSLTMTHFDVFGIETWTPDADKVASVTLNANGDIELTEKEDIENIIRLQEMALEDRLEQGGAYPVSWVEAHGRSNVPCPEEGFQFGVEGGYDRMEPQYYADWITITYLMEGGREVTRNYTIWASFEEGEIVKEYASRWEVVFDYARPGYEDEPDFNRIHDMTVDGHRVPAELMTAEAVEQLLSAIRADCEERTMTQDTYYHSGRFKVPVESEYDEREFWYNDSLYIDISTYTGQGKDLTGFWIRVFPDSAHTMQWLRDNGLLTYEIVEGNFQG